MLPRLNGYSSCGEGTKRGQLSKLSSYVKVPNFVVILINDYYFWVPIDLSVIMW